jgi:hypothetical protein
MEKRRDIVLDIVNPNLIMAPISTAPDKCAVGQTILQLSVTIGANLFPAPLSQFPVIDIFRLSCSHKSQQPLRPACKRSAPVPGEIVGIIKDIGGYTPGMIVKNRRIIIITEKLKSIQHPVRLLLHTVILGGKLCFYRYNGIKPFFSRR